MAEITCEAFSELEDEVKQEFFEDVVAAIQDINNCVTELENSIDESVIDRMFRSIHTVKGNCNMVFLIDFVNSSHRLEDLFSAIRSKNITYHSVYGHFAVAIVNLILKELKSLVNTTKADGDILNNLKLLIDQVIDAEDVKRIEVAGKAITAIDDGHFTISMVVQDSNNGLSFSFMDASDLEFFEYISNRYQQSYEHKSFFDICSTLANKLNQLLSNKADQEQLIAAIMFLHMTQKVETDGTASELDISQCIIASGLLSRMSGWTSAAELCIQAMEFHDGSGTSMSLKDSDILPAAQVLALSFEFAFHIQNSGDLGYKQSLFSAVKSINAKKNIRYKEKLVVRFNNLVKSEYLTNQMF